MEIKETLLKGCYLIHPRIFEDSRGQFFESYNKAELEKLLGTEIRFVQDNHSVSSKGVLRGLHFQRGEHAQTKLVRVIAGEVLDVVVDMRPESPTYGQHFKTKLSAKNNNMLFIPKGMAHGFLCLSDPTIFTYKCDNYYHPESEGGIIYNDPSLNIDWEFPSDKIILSEKDKNLPAFNNLEL